jgi:hypothetical protein
MLRAVLFSFSSLAIGCGANATDDGASAGAAESAGPSADFDRVYSGKLDATPMILRLKKTGAQLSGARVDVVIDDISVASIQGFDHPMKGSVAADGSVTLDEYDAANSKVLLTWRGTLASDGGLTGTIDAPRIGDGRDPPRPKFTLRPLEPGAAAGPDGAILGWHRFVESDTTCLSGGKYPEVFGIADTHAETALNKELAAIAQDSSQCGNKPKGSVIPDVAIEVNAKGVLSIATGSHFMDPWTGATLSRTERFITVSLKTGNAIPLASMLKAGTGDQLANLVDAALAQKVDVPDDLADDFRTAIAAGKLAVLVLDSMYNEMRISGLLLSPFDGETIPDDAAERVPNDLYNNLGTWGVFIPWTDLAPLVDPKSEVAPLAGVR